MKGIKVEVIDDSFIVSSVQVKRELADTNLLKDNTLYYSNRYLKKNSEKVKIVLSEYIINKVIYKDFDAYFSFCDISVKVKVFDVNKSLSPKIMDDLLKDSELKSIECYFMPSDYVHLFAEKGLSIKFNNNMMFTSKFVECNDLKNLKSIYYKKSINFYSDEDVYLNLEFFLEINLSLKLIHLYSYSNELIDYIVRFLDVYKFNDVDIFIHQNDVNLKDISSGVKHLREVNKKYSNKKNREIKLIYSNEFFKKNIFKQLTLNGMKLSMIFLLYLGLVLIVSDKYHEYITFLNLRKLENSLLESEAEDGIIIDEIDDEDISHVEEENPVPDVEPEEPKEYVNWYANVPTSFDKLLKINKDVVGWLKVNNTKVNYAVTQGSDNEYYLGHDIYNKKYTTGWIFMDYRNDAVNLSKNTVIYGHNLKTGYMFGDLKNTTNKEWYVNKDNQIITFNTVGKEMKWKIFSMYKTEYTTDYLKVNFYDDNDFSNFLDMIKNRSIYNFGVNLGVDDKVLTLSTCSGSNNRRLVIHAVLIS